MTNPECNHCKNPLQITEQVYWEKRYSMTMRLCYGSHKLFEEYEEIFLRHLINEFTKKKKSKGKS